MRKLFYCLLFLFMLFPMSVFAEGPVNDSKIYFYDYPNGYRTVSQSRDSSIADGEILLYSGRTDENGKVVLNGFEQKGEVRIVEKIPNGYTTTNKEYTINLAREDSVKFVNTESLIVNPKTARSFFVIFALLGIFGSLFYLIMHRQDDLLVLSIGLIVFFITSAASASSKSFVITVQDGNGKAMSNVEVEVYSKPSKVYSSYYVVYDANGGVFPSGEDKYYIPIPDLTVSVSDLIEYFSYDEYVQIQKNIIFVQKEGYVIATDLTIEEGFYNGQVIDMQWVRDSIDRVSNIDLNGGSLSFINSVYDHIKIPSKALFNFFPFIEDMKNDDFHFIGFDNNARCSHFDQYGLSEYFFRGSKMPPFLIGFDATPDDSAVYACWHEQPDGMYFDDSILLGNSDSCYSQSRLDGNMNVSNDLKIIYFDSYESNNEFHMGFSPRIPFMAYMMPYYHDDMSLLEKFETLKIIDHGEVVLSFDSSDFQYDSQDMFYDITNSNKLRQLREYFSSMSQCQ